MKKLIYLVAVSAISFQSCRQGQGDYDPKPVDPNIVNTMPLSYTDINGNYQLCDSVFFVQGSPIQIPTASDRYTPTRVIGVTINPSTNPAASFSFDNHTYFEDYNVANEYATTDKYYTIQKCRFIKDSVYIYYYKSDYLPDSSLTITVKGYKK